MSDSRRRWKESIEDLIKQGKIHKFQILTHPIWYNIEEKTLGQSVTEFINDASIDRYEALDNNFTNLGEIMKSPMVKK